jgi:hypothetical protein
MRLTLRTLLAYLDDALEPADAKEIGQKLAETPAAQALVTRIKEVTRRRRLTAPALSGDEIDPNLLAEYLDNLLPPDGVTKVEGTCLDSDVHLAEVAACHQVLTMIGQPASIAPTTRQRMYELVHSVESLPADQRRASRPRREAEPSSVFTERPTLARVFTAALVLVGVVAIGLLIWVSVNVQGRPGKPAGTEVADAGGDQGKPAPFRPSDLPIDSTETKPPDVPVGDPPQALPPDDEAGAAKPAPSKSGDEMEKPATTNAEPTAEPDQPKAAPSDDDKPVSEPAKPATEPAKSDANAATTKDEVQPAKPPVVLGQYVSTTGVLMRLVESAKEWRRMPAQSAVHADQQLLSLPSFRSGISIKGGPSIDLVGETELFLAEPPSEAQVRLRMARGRVVLSTDKPNTVFLVDFLDESWHMTIKAPETVVGLSVIPVWKTGGASSYEAILYVPRGDVDVHAEKLSHQLGGPVQFRWTPGGDQEREPLTIPPAWIEREEMSPAQLRASESLAEMIPLDKSPALSLIEATMDKDRRDLRLLGVRGLGAIGRLPALVDAMNTVDRPEVRKEAITTMRQFLARGAAQEEATYQSLLAKFGRSEERAEGVLALLRGFTADEATQRGAYEALIPLLDPETSPEVAVRELVITNLEEMAGRAINSNYSPDRPRDNDIKLWVRALEDGRLPPKKAR